MSKALGHTPRGNLLLWWRPPRGCSSRDRPALPAAPLCSLQGGAGARFSLRRGALRRRGGAERTGIPQPLPALRAPPGARGAAGSAPGLGKRPQVWGSGPGGITAEGEGTKRGYGGPGGRGGSGGCRAGWLTAKLTFKHPAPESSPPARPRGSEGFGGSLFAGLSPPFPRARPAPFLARISCQKTIPLSKSRARK